MTGHPSAGGARAAAEQDARPRAATPGVVRGVLLDIDDTLVNTRGAFDAAVGRIRRTWLPHLDDAWADRVLTRWVTDPGGHFRSYTRGDCDFSTQRRRRADDLHVTFGGPPLDDDGFAAWEREYDLAFRDAWALCADALPFLDALAGAGLPIGAVTNAGTAYQQDKLAGLGVLDRFGVVIGVDVLGRGKPDPEVFGLACRRLGLSPQECAYVGDELDLDARGARDAGLFGIWLDRHGTGLTPADVPVARTLPDALHLLGLAPAPVPRTPSP